MHMVMYDICIYMYVNIYTTYPNCSLLVDIAFRATLFFYRKKLDLSCDVFCFVAHIDVVIATKIYKLATKQQRTHTHKQLMRRTIT